MITDRDLTPPHGIARPTRTPLTPTVEQHDAHSIRLELGYGYEFGPGCRAQFIGTPEVIIRDYLEPLMSAARAAAESERDDALERLLDEEEAIARGDFNPADAVAPAWAADVLDDPALEPLALFAAGWLTAHPAHAIRHQMTLADAMHDQSVASKLSNFLEASCPRLDGAWRP